MCAVLVTQSCPTFVAAWAVAHQAHLPMEFSRQEYRSGLPFPFQGIFPDPEMEPGFPALQVNYLPSKPPRKPTGTFTLLKSDSQGSSDIKIHSAPSLL